MATAAIRSHLRVPRVLVTLLGYLQLLWMLLCVVGTGVFCLYVGIFAVAPLTTTAFVQNYPDLTWWGMNIWVFATGAGIITWSYQEIRRRQWEKHFFRWFFIVLAAMVMLLKLGMLLVGIY